MHTRTSASFILGTQNDSSKLSSLPPLSIEYVKDQAMRITTGIQSIICRELASIKTKIRTASRVTDTIHNYFTNRKRSLWLLVEDRNLLNRLGFIFRSNLRRTYSCSDLRSRHQNSNDSIGSNFERMCHDKDLLDQTNDGIHRYYHVFQKGELARLIRDNKTGLEICHEWFEQGNWVVIAKKS